MNIYTEEELKTLQNECRNMMKYLKRLQNSFEGDGVIDLSETWVNKVLNNKDPNDHKKIGHLERIYQVLVEETESKKNRTSSTFSFRESLQSIELPEKLTSIAEVFERLMYEIDNPWEDAEFVHDIYDMDSHFWGAVSTVSYKAIVNVHEDMEGIEYIFTVAKVEKGREFLIFLTDSIGNAILESVFNLSQAASFIHKFIRESEIGAELRGFFNQIFDEIGN